MSNTVVSAGILPAVTLGMFDIETSYTDDGTGILHSPASILRQAMIDEKDQLEISDTSDSDWYPYISFLPDPTHASINCISIFDEMGKKDSKLSDGTVVQFPGAQLHVRSVDYEEGYNKTTDLMIFLDIIENKLVEKETVAYTIGNVIRMTPIIPLGRTEKAPYSYGFAIDMMLNIKRYSN